MAHDVAKPPAAAPPQVRRTYLVKPRFQLKYSLLLSVLGAGTALLFGALMYRIQADALEEVVAIGAGSPALVARSATLVWILVALAGLLAAALALVGVVMTHRVAGPIYVLERYLATLEAGRYPSLRPLRREDELRQFFQRFAKALDGLRERDGQEADVLDRSLVRLEAHRDLPAVAQCLQELRAVHDRKRARAEKVG